MALGKILILPEFFQPLKISQKKSQKRQKGYRQIVYRGRLRRE